MLLVPLNTTFLVSANRLDDDNVIPEHKIMSSTTVFANTSINYQEADKGDGILVLKIKINNL